MGIKANIAHRNVNVNDADALTEKLYREERAYRADKLVEKWSKVAEIGQGIEDMNPTQARNLAILLENQTRVLSRLSEAQISSSFSGYTPENMLRLVRLAYPNSIRGMLFTEFAMETAHDSIKYIMPVYSKKSGMAGEYPYGVEGDDLMGNRFDDGKTPVDEVMYESTESRYATEMVNAAAADGTNEVVIDVKGANTAFGENGENYIDGYTEIYAKEGEKKVMLAMQTKEAFAGRGHAAIDWMLNPNGYLKGADRFRIAKVELTGGQLKCSIEKQTSGEGKWSEADDAIHTDIVAYARYNSETDLMGNYLGEVELVMKDYHFRPRPITLGVTWTQLTELVLDTSFGLSAEEMLMDAAAQEIKKTLDYQAVKFANGTQQARGNAAITFDAEPPAGEKTVTTKDSYWHTAQLIQQAIDAVGDAQLDKIGRGGVTSIVGGTAAVNYLKLNKGWTDRGRQPKIGAHKVGELDGMSVFKVPSNVIPSDELLTVWKNEANDSDVAIAIGTLLPFYSTGSIQRKNLYKEAAVARFEDTKALQPDYLGKIKIKNLRQAY